MSAGLAYQCAAHAPASRPAGCSSALGRQLRAGRLVLVPPASWPPASRACSPSSARYPSGSFHLGVSAGQTRPKVARGVTSAAAPMHADGSRTPAACRRAHGCGVVQMRQAHPPRDLSERPRHAEHETLNPSREASTDRSAAQPPRAGLPGLCCAARRAACQSRAAAEGAAPAR